MKTAINNSGIEIEVADNITVKTVDGVHYLLTPAEETEMLARGVAHEAGANNRSISAQIVALEAKQTPRRIREAIVDPTWMQSLNNQIAALRTQLT